MNFWKTVVLYSLVLLLMLCIVAYLHYRMDLPRIMAFAIGIGIGTPTGWFNPFLKWRNNEKQSQSNPSAALLSGLGQLVLWGSIMLTAPSSTTLWDVMAYSMLGMFCTISITQELRKSYNLRTMVDKE